MRHTILSCMILLAACAPHSAPQTPPPTPLLHPYATRTPSPTLAQPEGLLATWETPLPSPTPSIYEVQSGDTLSGIAYTFGVSLDELLALNPDVSPNNMPIGTRLKIPAASPPSASASTPTPVPAPIEQIACYPSAEGGVWCFVLVINDHATPLENLSARVILLDASGNEVTSGLALPPLDILSPGARLPLAVYFPPDVPSDIHPQAQLLSGILLLDNDTRYLPASLHNSLVQVDSSGRSAQVNGTVRLPGNLPPARVVWIAAVVYDRADRVVGLRRWELPAILPPGGEEPFDFWVASLAGEIERVELTVEARVR
ncbi:MAG: hypothetical protein Fur0043_03240 [Anaerolineales bacterium]